MGFSIAGTLIGILILLPSILFFIKFPPKNVPVGITDGGMVYTIFERIGQAGCMIVLVLSRDNFKGIKVDLWGFLMIFCIIMYYCLWIRYTVRGQDYKWLWEPFIVIPIPLAVFPILAYGFAAIWGKSIWLGAASVLLAVGHIPLSWHSYKNMKQYNES